MTSQLPHPEEVKKYFMNYYVGKTKPVCDVSFSTQWTRVKLSISAGILVYEAIDFLNSLKKHKLTNLHMTYMDKSGALSIYFELDRRVAKMIKPTNPVATTIKEMF